MVEKLDWRTFIDAKPDTDAATIKALDAYFPHFVAVPIEEKDGKKELGTQRCVGCDEPLTGLFGRFTWGVVHGEGHCAGCGWSARAHHFIKDADGEELMTLRNFILQVHPDFVSKRGAA